VPQRKRYCLVIEAVGGLGYAAMRQDEEGTIGMATSSGPAAGGGLSSGELQIGWQYRAACKGPVSNLFFAPNHLERKEQRLAREAAAKAICRTCPVLTECREYALLVREPHGIWGGLNEYERRQLLARRAG